MKELEKRFIIQGRHLKGHMPASMVGIWETVSESMAESTARKKAEDWNARSNGIEYQAISLEDE